MFNTLKFLVDNFETPTGLKTLLDTHIASSPPRDTVRKWFERDSIPGEWWPAVVFVLERQRGKPVSLADYIRTGECHDLFG